MFSSNALTIIGAVSNAVGSNSVLNFSGVLNQIGIAIGNAAGVNAAVYQTAGTMSNQETAVEALNVANIAGSYGYFEQSGGTNYLGGIAIGGEGITGNASSFATGGNGLFELSGGVVNNVFNGHGWIVMNRGGTSATEYAVMNIFGGSLNYSSGWAANWGTGQTSVVNIMGGVVSNTANVGPNMMDNTGGGQNVGILNLNGGTLQGSANYGTGAVLNFNGGIFAPFTNIANLFQNSGGTYLYSNGGSISNGYGGGVTNTGTISNPTGLGVIGWTNFVGGSNYIAPPIVIITNGGGSNATAIAQICTNVLSTNLGKVTNVIITCPGLNYTSQPTFVFKGGGGSNASITNITLGTNRGGPLYILGANTTDFGGSNTYTNATIINGSTLQLVGSNRDC